jgi:(E)-4-hydroxy-3-methylbut-2-enyl-diphosphate synthase
MKTRRPSREIHIGSVAVGGGNPVVIQSMTTTDTRDTEATLAQIAALQRAGCQLVRLAVPDTAAAEALPALCRRSEVPLIADIHFDYRLALQAVDAGIAGLRINPGNIGAESRVRELVAACQDKKIPLRIGVNSGSLAPEILRRYGGVNATALVESALEHVAILEAMHFTDIKISLKASSVPLTVAAYELMAERVDYPLHLGVTEAGTPQRALIKSALALGQLLSAGIGDTIRVSITGDPVDEVWAGYAILRGLGLSERGAELISCPTCGRTAVDILPLAQQVDAYLKNISTPITVAVMGCVVNGPGEAREADVGIAGGKGQFVLFKKGQIAGKIEATQAWEVLKDEIDRLASSQTVN